MPPPAGGQLWRAASIGIAVADGDVAGAVPYTVIHLAPAATIAIRPPR